MPNVSSQEYVNALLQMPLAQFKQFKKAIRVLCATGIYRDDAVRILMEQYLSNGGKLNRVA